MKIKLRPTKAYMVISESGKEVAQVTMVSQWEGLMKLATADGRVIICEKPEAMQELMASAGVGWLGTTVECEALKASPDLLLQMAKPAPAAKDQPKPGPPPETGPGVST